MRSDPLGQYHDGNGHVWLVTMIGSNHDLVLPSDEARSELIQIRSDCVGRSRRD